jgi:hypothetical protein
MNIKNKYCLLSELAQVQIDKLMVLMPDTPFFDFLIGESLLGFTCGGSAGTFQQLVDDEIITYEEMLSLLGAKEEEEKLVPHVHQKEIIAWANGEEIEYYNTFTTTWKPKGNSLWETFMQYRAKPKLTPTQLRIQELTEEIVKLKEQDAVESGIGLVMGGVGCQQFED